MEKKRINRRLNITLAPSLHDAAATHAQNMGMSFSALIAHLLRDELQWRERLKASQSRSALVYEDDPIPAGAEGPASPRSTFAVEVAAPMPKSHADMMGIPASHPSVTSYKNRTPKRAASVRSAK